MNNLIRCNSDNKDFQDLVKELDIDLAIRDGDDHAFYHQFNKINSLQHVIVAYESSIAVGCGAIKEFSSDTMEIKRMFVLPQNRGKGIACLLYTSDAADERSSVDLGGRRIIKKKITTEDE